MSQLRWKQIWSLAGLAIVISLGSDVVLAYTTPYSTPSGITLVDVSSGAGTVIPKFLWRRLGDAQGNPLYTYDLDQEGKSSCYAECAKRFPPFVADAHSQPLGDFSILARADGVRQWVYQGKALYRYSGKDPIGEPSSIGSVRPDDPAVFDPASDIYSPKSGWRRAAYTPEKTIAMPPDVELDALAVANGFGFVEVATHKTVYAAPLSHKLSSDWQPLRASALARPVGEFSIVEAKQYGTRQWTYKGEGLYTYASDYAADEVGGIFSGDKKIQAALLYRNFIPPGIQITQYVGRGPLMTTTKGLALYYVARFVGAHGGRDTRHGGYAITYNDAKSQGAQACQAECTQSWRPVQAAGNAEASGFWEVVRRPDGNRQWAFKGSPVYLFVGDKPGDIDGNNRSVVVYGGSSDEVIYAYAEADQHFPQPRLGKIDLDFAVGSRADAGAEPASRNATPAAGAIGAGGTPAATGRTTQRKPDRRAGAGFYWHTVGLFY
jgi:predicted lipoprotein with Yx(FWY)xxD motif